jgi:hypothetical protein
MSFGCPHYSAYGLNKQRNLGGFEHTLEPVNGFDLWVMIEINLFSIIPLKNKLPKAVLEFNGKSTGIIVDGVILGKQIQVDAGYLIFFQKNSPFEEGLHIYLLVSACTQIN